MKKFLLILLSCSVLSCGGDEEELINDEDTEEVIEEEGNGTDPCLNMYEYTFSSEGDSISIYSIEGHNGLSVGNYIISGSTSSSVMYKLYYSDDGRHRGFYTDWWYAACPDTKPHGSRIDIVVQPNDTGEEREIPIHITYYDWGGGGGKFIQEK